MRHFLSAAFLPAAFMTAGFMTAGFLAAAWAAPAEAQGADAGVKTPGIFEVELEGGAISHYVVGDGAWGDVLFTLGSLQDVDEPGIADQLWARRDSNPPVFLFEYARRTVESDPDQAVYAYLLGRMRTLYDAQRCLDSSALQTVPEASLYAGEAVSAALENAGRVQAQIDRLRASGEAFTSQASPWWICSSSTTVYFVAQNGGSMTRSEWLKTENRWPALREGLTGQLDEWSDAFGGG